MTTGASTMTDSADRQTIGAGPHWLGERLMIDCVDSPDGPPTDADFAFAGTVTAVDPSPVPSEEDDTPHGRWTFAVDEWFTEAGPDEVTVAVMFGLETVTSSGGGEYQLGVGDRLLISGEVYEESGENQPWSGLIAGSCGYSRTYDEATASEWQELFSRP